MGNKQATAPSAAPGHEADSKFFGINNFGNTCYFNSVFQSLYHCRTFRTVLLDYRAQHLADDNDSLLSMLGGLFEFIQDNHENSGTLQPREFFARVGEQNPMFVGSQHQDAHEFLHFLLSELSERVSEQKKADGDTAENWVEGLFEGALTNQMQCLRCDAISSRDEKFMDLSVDIANHTSLTACLKEFGKRELLSRDCKFRCSECHALQEAYKWMQVKSQPAILICHLKRFKCTDAMEFTKLSYRVCFSEQLRLPNLSEGVTPRLYDLFAIVVHVGAGASHGHYVAIVRKGTVWYLYDDHVIHALPDDWLQNVFGSLHAAEHTDGYILFYQDCQLEAQ
ncbi:USP domain-containing protein [Plasmodiophora brassicae]|uniref:ubiquitinyl hydrolase 1 n=2 Tax=Plasmodiophora brassicae TaxID=37360 RepID=A0A3P3YCD6_PLABS|nr:unnamed protein product [Plasmodiophora brassicae]